MTQSIYFYKLNSKELCNNDFTQVLTAEFTILKDWFAEKKIDLDNNDELQSKLLESIDISDIRLSAKSEKFISLLKTKDVILNKSSTFYFIDEALWSAIKSTFFEEINAIEKQFPHTSIQEIYDKYLRKFAITESIYEDHKLIIRVI